MTFDEAMARYDGQWLVMRVLTVDAQRLPRHVQVLARSPDYASVCRAFVELVPTAEVPAHPYYVGEAYRHIRTGAEMRAALHGAQEAAEQGEDRGLGVWRSR